MLKQTAEYETTIMQFERERPKKKLQLNTCYWHFSNP